MDHQEPALIRDYQCGLLVLDDEHCPRRQRELSELVCRSRKMVQSMKAGAIGWIGEDDVDEVGAGPQAEGVEVFRAEVCVLLSGFVAAGGAQVTDLAGCDAGEESEHQGTVLPEPLAVHTGNVHLAGHQAAARVVP
jgi:hypothetical protein